MRRQERNEAFGMYIHVGGEYSLSDKYIVGIFDIDNTTIQPSETINFLSRKEQDGLLEVVSPELPRSFIVTLDRVYVTPISPGTLRRRLIRADGGSRTTWPGHEREVGRDRENGQGEPTLESTRSTRSKAER